MSDTKKDNTQLWNAVKGNLEQYPIIEEHLKDIIKSWISNSGSKPLEFPIIRSLYCGYGWKLTYYEEIFKKVKKIAALDNFFEELKNEKKVNAETSGKLWSLLSEVQAIAELQGKYPNLKKVSNKNYFDLENNKVRVSVKTILSITSNENKILDCIEAALIRGNKKSKLRPISIKGADKIGDSFRRDVLKIIRSSEFNNFLNNLLYPSSKLKKNKLIEENIEGIKLMGHYKDCRLNNNIIILEITKKNPNKKIELKFIKGKPLLGCEKEREISVNSYWADYQKRPDHNRLNYNYFKNKKFPRIITEFNKGYNEYTDKKFVPVLNIIYDYKHQGYIFSNKKEIEDKFQTFLKEKLDYEIFVHFFPNERATYNDVFSFKI